MSVQLVLIHSETGRRFSTREAITEVLNQFGTLTRGRIIEILRSHGYTKQSIDKTLTREKDKAYPHFFKISHGKYEITEIGNRTSTQPVGAPVVQHFTPMPGPYFLHNIQGKGEVCRTWSSWTKLRIGKINHIPLSKVDERFGPGKYLKILIQEKRVQFWISNKRPGYTPVELLRVINFMQRIFQENGLDIHFWFTLIEFRSQQNVKVKSLEGILEIPMIEEEVIYRAYEENGSILNEELRFQGTITKSEMIDILTAKRGQIHLLDFVDRISSNMDNAFTNTIKTMNGFSQWIHQVVKSVQLLQDAAIEQISNVGGVSKNVQLEIKAVSEALTEIEQELDLKFSKMENEVFGMVQSQGNVVSTMSKSLNKIVDHIGSRTESPPPSKNNQNQPRNIISLSKRELEIADELIRTISESPGQTKNQVIKNIKAAKSTKLKILNQLISGGIITMIKFGQKQLCYYNQKEDLT